MRFVSCEGVKTDQNAKSGQITDQGSNTKSAEQVLLLGQLHQHGVVEELVHRHVLRQSLPTPRLDHELACQMRGRLQLQRTNHNALVQRVARNNL